MYIDIWVQDIYIYKYTVYMRNLGWAGAKPGKSPSLKMVFRYDGDMLFHNPNEPANVFFIALAGQIQVVLVQKKQLSVFWQIDIWWMSGWLDGVQNIMWSVDRFFFFSAGWFLLQGNMFWDRKLWTSTNSWHSAGSFRLKAKHSLN